MLGAPSCGVPTFINGHSRIQSHGATLVAILQAIEIAGMGPRNHRSYCDRYKVVPPQLCLLVYNPNNYRYNPLINPSYSTYLHQLNANELGHHLVPPIWVPEMAIEFLGTPKGTPEISICQPAAELSLSAAIQSFLVAFS